MQQRGGFAGIGLAGRCCALLVSGGAVAGVMFWSEHEEPSPQLQQRMTGQFVLDESRSELEMRLGQAVERVVQPLGATVRSVARAQLSRVVTYCREYDMELALDGVRVQCDETAEIEQGLRDVASGRGREDAAALEVELAEDAVVLSAEGVDGERTTTYRFDGQGRLEVNVRVTSQQLDRPLAWSVRYRRVTPEVPVRTPAVAASLAEH